MTCSTWDALTVWNFGTIPFTIFETKNPHIICRIILCSDATIFIKYSNDLLFFIFVVSYLKIVMSARMPT